MAKERFVEVYSQGVTNVRKIIVDAETGVNYFLASSNMTSGCGVTVLTPLSENDEIAWVNCLTDKTLITI